jgi:hypothetical protein
LGRATVPTFFWGGSGRQGAGQIMGQRLILMGDWSDLLRYPDIDKTGATKAMLDWETLNCATTERRSAWGFIFSLTVAG